MSYKVYLVGGAVRDQLLQLPVHERDWVVVGATPHDLLKQGYQQVGKHFPVFLHPTSKDEYALARIERKEGHGYQGFSCYFSQDVSLEDDLMRRDLTINAMAMDDNGQIIDPYGGLHDLKNKTLRHVSKAFIEDPLRVLRVARFAARFKHLGFKIAPETMALMQEIAASNELTYLSVERIWKEFELAFATLHPETFIDTLKDSHALNILAPALLDLSLDDLLHLNRHHSNMKANLVVYLSGLDHQHLTSFAQQFKLPKHLVHLIQHFKLSKEILLQPTDAKSCLNTLESIDAFRQKTFFFELLEIIELWGYPQFSPSIKQFWHEVMLETQKIKLPQTIHDHTHIKNYFKENRCLCIARLLKHYASLF